MTNSDIIYLNYYDSKIYYEHKISRWTKNFLSKIKNKKISLDLTCLREEVIIDGGMFLNINYMEKMTEEKMLE